MKTYVSLIEEISPLKIKMLELNAELNSIPGLFFIQAAEARASFFDNDKDKVKHLVDEINERDFPLTKAEIIEILNATGWGYTDQDVAECNPDSLSLVLNFRRGDY